MEQLPDVIEQHEQRISDNERRIGRLAFAVYGDSESKYAGLMDRQKITEDAIKQMATQWRDIEVRYQTIILFLRIGVAIAVIIAAGTWAPQLDAILSWFGG